MSYGTQVEVMMLTSTHKEKQARIHDKQEGEHDKNSLRQTTDASHKNK